MMKMLAELLFRRKHELTDDLAKEESEQRVRELERLAYLQDVRDVQHQRLRKS